MMYPAICAVIASGVMLTACGAPGHRVTPTPPEARTSPYAPDGEACNDDMARGEVGERIEAGDPDAMRCFLSLRDVEPDSFSLRYRIYRIEGVEPQGLDQIVRSHHRLELATRIAVVHGLADELEEIKFHPMSACRMFDPVARELLARTPAQSERKGCRRWGL